ncbi:MAG TPA: hypothetical protein VI408_02440 [Gaiellaceae bacterium]
MKSKSTALVIAAVVSLSAASTATAAKANMHSYVHQAKAGSVHQAKAPAKYAPMRKLARFS